MSRMTRLLWGATRLIVCLLLAREWWPSGLPAPRRWDALYGSTVKLSIIPLSWCSAMWQCAIQTAGMGDVEEDVDGLAGRDEHGVLPDEVGLGDAVAGEDEEAAGAVDVERMVHRVVRVHLVDDPDLDLVADAEAPVDPMPFRSGVSVDELPAHVRWGGDAVDLEHVVLPLDPAGVVAVLAAGVVRMPVLIAVAVIGSCDDELGGDELHAAVRAAIGRVACHLRMHRAGVSDWCGGRREELHPAFRAAAGFVSR